MSLKGIISISGMSGLHKILTTNKSGFIVESLADKKRFAVASTQRVSTLEDITIYTEDGDVPLKEVLRKLDERAGKGINADPKADPEQLKKEMGEILPEYDRERVYTSDIKKLFSWYGILKENEYSFEDEPEETESQEEKAPTHSKEEKKEPKQTAAGKKKAKKSEEKAEAPKKKTEKETKEPVAKKAAKKKAAPKKKSADTGTEKKSAKTKTAKKSTAKKK